MKRMFLCLSAAFAVLASAFAAGISEISVDIKMDESQYVSGERIRAVVDVRNMSPEPVSVGYGGDTDKLLVEVYRASDRVQLEKKTPASSRISAAFRVDSNQGEKLEVFLGDHYALMECRRYLVRAVLVHNGYRYEGTYRVFDVVPGTKVASAMQMFANHPGKSRHFELLRWTRRGVEHIFVTAWDEGGDKRTLGTMDIGAMLKATPPTISILPSGEVIVIHRNGADSLVRSEFWSLPDVLKLKSRILVADPATAGQKRVKELYKEGGGIKPTSRPWWKFW